MTITARLENHSSDIVEQVLIHFISCENDHSASVLVISRVQAMSKDDGYLGKYLHPKHPMLVKGHLEAPYLLTARVFSIYLPHFQGIWEVECLSPRTACLLLHHPAAVPYLL